VHNDLIAIPESIWSKLNTMLEEGDITSVRCVYDEIVTDAKKPDKVSAWLKSKKLLFHTPSNQEVIFMAEAVKLFPGLVNPASEKEQADAWLVAHARMKSIQDPSKEYVLVNQENPNSKVKIPAACDHYGIRSISMKEFFEENGINLGS
jgi:hypothetical protein